MQEAPNIYYLVIYGPSKARRPENSSSSSSSSSHPCPSLSHYFLEFIHSLNHTSPPPAHPGFLPRYRSRLRSTAKTIPKGTAVLPATRSPTGPSAPRSWCPDLDRHEVKVAAQVSGPPWGQKLRPLPGLARLGSLAPTELNPAPSPGHLTLRQWPQGLQLARSLSLQGGSSKLKHSPRPVPTTPAAKACGTSPFKSMPG